MKPRIIIAEDHRAFIQQAADMILQIGQEALAKHGRFSMALSGGSTPQPIYQKLAEPDFANSLDWSNVHIFWSDERAVPPDHPDSNYRMAQEDLLDRVPIPKANIHRMRGEIEPLRAAVDYEEELREFFPLPKNTFDLVLLGMGGDGHTASLFPGSAALEEKEKWVTANLIEKLNSWRITLTYPAINSVTNVLFLVSGGNKAAALKSVLEGNHHGNQFPAGLVKPTAGNLIWLLDQEAASLLSFDE